MLPLFGAYQIGNLISRVPAVLSCQKYDVTWLERELLPGFFSFEKYLKRPCMFDVDDSIWCNKPFGEISSRKICNYVDVVIAGNEYIADWFSSYIKSIEIIPTSVDVDIFHPKNIEEREGKFILGWTGSCGNLKYVYEIEKYLSQFMSLCSDVELHILCDAPPTFSLIPSKRVKFIPWSPEVEAEVLRSWDVGIMPLPDNDFARGKCSFKMLQYMATAIPVVVSPVGMNKKLLEMGPIGFSANNGEWVDSLLELYNDSSLRDNMGTVGRNIVINDFSSQVVLPRIANVISSML